MNQLRLTWILLMTALTTLSASAASPDTLAIASEIRQLVAWRYPAEDRPGCAVLVRLRGANILEEGFGVTSLSDPRPITAETSFRLASVTKQFTAAATLRLVEQGKLSLDDSLVDIFPDFPAWGAGVRVRHLLGHTGALPDYEDLLPEGLEKPVLDADVLEIMRRQPGTIGAPGARYTYSNSGYAVLAMIVEKRSGKRFADFLHDEFFTPLGMAGTVAFENGRNTVPRRAFGHTAGEAGAIRASDQSLTSSVLGDGGVYTSVRDYSKWADAWFSGKVLQEPLASAAWTPAKLPGGEANTYGYGWRIAGEGDDRVVHHTGSTVGFSTYVRLVPARRLCVAVFANRSGEEPKELAPLIEARVLEWDKASARGPGLAGS